MATYQVQNHFMPDENVLDKIIDALKAKSLSTQPMKIRYNQYLLDSSAIIIAGDFCEAQQKLISIPTQIDVGYYKNDGKTFELHSLFNYKLKSLENTSY